MRISAAISLLILAVAALFGWWDQHELAGLRSKNIRLTGEATAMGKDIGKSGYEEGSRWIKENDFSEAEITNLIAGGLVSHAVGDQKGQWLEWMGENLSEEPRERFISANVTEWTRNDHRAAGEWLAALPDGPSKPASVAAFAKTVAPHDSQDDPARVSFMAKHPAE